MVQQLERKWFEVHGIDISKKMLENAAEIHPNWVFIEWPYEEYIAPISYDCIVWLAFIHLFDHSTVRKLLRKMYNDLADDWIVHLTTTLEDSYEYCIRTKKDYWTELARWRMHYTPESFVDILKESWLRLEAFTIEHSAYDKQWMSLTARKV